MRYNKTVIGNYLRLSAFLFFLTIYRIDKKLDL
jgi:hypothetical protein